MTGTKQLLPFVFCNSVAVNNAFHLVEAVQPGVFSKLAAEGKYSRRVFWIGDFLFHVLVSTALPPQMPSAPGRVLTCCVQPVLVTYLAVRRKPESVRWYHGLMSCCYHFLWSIRVAGGFNLVSAH